MGVIRKYTRMYKPQQLSIPFDRAFLDMIGRIGGICPNEMMPFGPIGSTCPIGAICTIYANWANWFHGPNWCDGGYGPRSVPSASSRLLPISMMCPARFAHRCLSTAEERKGYEFCLYASAQSGCSTLTVQKVSYTILYIFAYIEEYSKYTRV